MTCVRTSTGGCRIAASDVLWALEPARSARALSTPAASIVTAAAVLVWVIRIGFPPLGRVMSTVARGGAEAAQVRAKLWQRA
jgi:hypothetical protein